VRPEGHRLRPLIVLSTTDNTKSPQVVRDLQFDLESA
jgi:hypothetical protein